MIHTTAPADRPAPPTEALTFGNVFGGNVFGGNVFGLGGIAYAPCDDDSAEESSARAAVARILLRVDADGRCVYADMNRAAVNYFGLTRGEVIGRTPAEVFFPDHARQLDALHQECITRRQRLRYQRQRPFPNGLRTYDVVMRPILGSGDGVWAIEVTARDITGDQAAPAG